ncbi:anti-sigma factor [Nonomuraea sp. NN258]|uniref:anti-sigma factor n=1 Tax=Nonomuraea antri TaxID=2730852 RepID=UPI001568E57E|nr:anti-sigma factor [Nonomuraea antri]NRQ32134.1 anti-sigma factor [Nonomuraea antri]
MKTREGRFDPHTLAGAYALGAIDDEGERRRFERHLTGCAECAQETATLGETVARLGTAVAAEPPPGLRERVLAEIEQVRQLPPQVPPASRARRVWRVAWRPWPAAVSVAAALAVLTVLAGLAGLGVSTVQARQELEQARRVEQRIAAVLSADDARTVTALAAPATAPSAGAGRSGRGTVVLSRSQGALVFWAAGLSDPPAGRVYQLWQLAPGQITSAGLLTSSGSGGTLPVLAAISAGAGQVGMTVEPAGGSRQPTGTPLLLVDLPAA